MELFIVYCSTLYFPPSRVWRARHRVPRVRSPRKKPVHLYHRRIHHFQCTYFGAARYLATPLLLRWRYLAESRLRSTSVSRPTRGTASPPGCFVPVALCSFRCKHRALDSFAILCPVLIRLLFGGGLLGNLQRPLLPINLFLVNHP